MISLKIATPASATSEPPSRQAPREGAEPGSLSIPLTSLDLPSRRQEEGNVGSIAHSTYADAMHVHERVETCRVSGRYYIFRRCRPIIVCFMHVRLFGRRSRCQWRLQQGSGPLGKCFRVLRAGPQASVRKGSAPVIRPDRTTCRSSGARRRATCDRPATAGRKVQASCEQIVKPRAGTIDRKTTRA